MTSLFLVRASDGRDGHGGFRHGVICQSVAKPGAVGPFFWSGKAHGQQRNAQLQSCSIASWRSRSARPSSAEAFLRAVKPQRFTIVMDRKCLSYDPNKSIWVGCGGSMWSVGAGAGAAAVGSAGLVFRSRNSLSFLKSSRSGTSMLSWCRAAAGCSRGKRTKSFK